VIHAFNDIGFKALDPKGSGGRPATISERARWQIRLIARCRPRDLGLAFSAWSLTKLAEYVVDTGVVASVSRESIRQILRSGGIRWQATKTWKASADPDFIAKMHRVLDLYDHRPVGGRVICADEFGSLNLQAWPGRGWQPAGHPARLRASRQALPDRGQLLPYKHPEVTRWAAAHDVELVYLPIYSSWLNWIEPEFAALRYFTLNGTDHRTHAEQGDAIARYLRWRNARVRPKRDFGPRLSDQDMDQLPEQGCLTRH
jgi:transposase